MDLLKLSAIRDQVVDAAIERSKQMPEALRKDYINACTDAAVEFYCYSMIQYLDTEAEKRDKRSA